jgi:enoyl-CoA hydratase
MSAAHQRLQRLANHLAPAAAAAAVQLSPVPTAAATGTTHGAYEQILVEQQGRVGVITLNRPKALNALSDQLMSEVGQAIQVYEATENVGCIVLTGAGKAFAAGADIKEMVGKTYYEASTVDKIAPWEAISRARIPIVAAVNGFALGGGCEIAMMCDIIFASQKAKFGQPEITIGTIPGAGGTQRLTRAIGKSKAMEMCLTGRMCSAEEMERAGLVSAVLPHDELLPHAMKTAAKIASLSKPIVVLCKEAVSAAYETGLAQGVRTERRLFHSTFALADRKEGMSAFQDKRKPEWQHRG